jgi:hypothetical protein
MNCISLKYKGNNIHNFKPLYEFILEIMKLYFLYLRYFILFLLENHLIHYRVRNKLEFDDFCWKLVIFIILSYSPLWLSLYTYGPLCSKKCNMVQTFIILCSITCIKTKKYVIHASEMKEWKGNVSNSSSVSETCFKILLKYSNIIASLNFSSKWLFI